MNFMLLQKNKLKKIMQRQRFAIRRNILNVPTEFKFHMIYQILFLNISLILIYWVQKEQHRLAKTEKWKEY